MTWRAAVCLLLVVLQARAVHAERVDTQFLFGFTQGADVGTFGEKEIESQTIGRFGKADGAYSALTSQLRAEFTPFQHFRFEVGALATYHSIAGLSDLDDRDSFQFGGFVMEARYRLLDRRSAPFALTVGVEPHWQRVDEISGELVSSWGGDFTVAIDQELIPDRLFAALNLLYAPEWTDRFAAQAWQQQSTLGVSGAATWHGVYAPSPGLIYPTLTMLHEMGQIEEAQSGGARKAFAVTPDGTSARRRSTRCSRGFPSSRRRASAPTTRRSAARCKTCARSCCTGSSATTSPPRPFTGPRRSSTRPRRESRSCELR